ALQNLLARCVVAPVALHEPQQSGGDRGAQHHGSRGLRVVHHVAVGRPGGPVTSLAHYGKLLGDLVGRRLSGSRYPVGDPSELLHALLHSLGNGGTDASYVPGSLSFLFPPSSEPITRRIPRVARCVTVGAGRGAGAAAGWLCSTGSSRASWRASLRP